MKSSYSTPSDRFIILRKATRIVLGCIVLLATASCSTSCSKPLPWPEAPLYVFDEPDKEASTEYDLTSVQEKIAGHYAHYDVVAYEDTTTKTTMRTFIISYGFTDFYIEDGKLMQMDRFVHSSQKLSQKKTSSGISDAATKAIKPRVQEVELILKDSTWHIYRPPTPSLLGITGDPMQPLSTDPNDPNLTDPDGDGNPGVTVSIKVSWYFSGEIYITRREIFRNYLRLNRDGTLSGYVIDDSEQFVVGASKKILNQPSNAIQHEDMGLSPLLLVPINPNIDTWEELLEIRDELFPPEPDFQ